MPADHILSVILPEARDMGRLATERLLAGFRDIDDEANKVGDDSWSRWRSQPATGDEDPADGAAEAWDEEVAHYTALTNLRQAVLNLLATKINHLVEHLTDYSKTARRLGRTPLEFPDLMKLPSAAAVYELRLVANTAKHGEGESAEKLRKVRPDLFQNPIFTRMGYVDPLPHARAPFAGDGLFVSEADVEKYQAAAEAFWNELADYHSTRRRTA